MFETNNSTPKSFPAELQDALKSTDNRIRQIAWQQFHTRYAPIIASFARRYDLQASDLDDVVQEVLVGFCGAAPEFVYDPAKGRFRGYLKTCVHNEIRRRFAAMARGLRTVPIADFDQAASEPEEIFDEICDVERLPRALADVRSRYELKGGAKTFAVFEHHVLLGLDARDTAATFGVSIDSVHQSKHRVTTALQKRLRELAKEQGDYLTNYAHSRVARLVERRPG